jgi:chemotaxis protein methyltransferase CheR
VIPSSLAQIVERVAGLSLDRGGVQHTLDRHVVERMRKLELRTVEDYRKLLVDPAGVELRALIEAITVQHTWFFRDREQLQVIEKLLSEAPIGPLDVWIAGCATGEEAYTLAMIGRRLGRELHMLATDVNESALQFARRGVYGTHAWLHVPDGHRHLLAASGNDFVVDPSLRAKLRFERHNLVDVPPRAPRGAWDLIVCRNVLMYFAPAPAARVRERFARALRDGGWLILGASEIVSKPPPGLELVPVDKRLVIRRPLPRPLRRPPLGTPPGSAAPAAGSAAPAAGSAPLTARSAPAPASPPKPLQPDPARTPPPPPPSPPTAAPSVTRGPPPAADDLVARLNSGHALFERGETGAAIQVYADVAARYTDVGEVRLFLGIARFTIGDIEGAAEALRASNCLAPALWPAAFYLARVYERLGRHAEARQQWDHVAVDSAHPISLLSTSAIANELRALQHDFQAVARLATERAASLRRPR